MKRVAHKEVARFGGRFEPTIPLKRSDLGGCKFFLGLATTTRHARDAGGDQTRVRVLVFYVSHQMQATGKRYIALHSLASYGIYCEKPQSKTATAGDLGHCAD